MNDDVEKLLYYVKQILTEGCSDAVAAICNNMASILRSLAEPKCKICGGTGQNKEATMVYYGPGPEDYEYVHEPCPVCTPDPKLRTLCPKCKSVLFADGTCPNCGALSFTYAKDTAEALEALKEEGSMPLSEFKALCGYCQPPPSPNCPVTERVKQLEAENGRLREALEKEREANRLLTIEMDRNL